MIAPIRAQSTRVLNAAALRSVSAASCSSTSSSSAVASSSRAVLIAKRPMVTKAERWTPALAHSPALPDASNAQTKADLTATLPNIEARWGSLSKEEQFGVFRLLEEIQKKDWKELSIDEKKAAYFISFGPHGPRKPITAPGQGLRTATGVVISFVATLAVFYGFRSIAAPAPKTLTTEYQEQMTQKALEEKQNPITGIASAGYKGQGHVQKSYV
ncbi:Cytochrome c oxidase subunit 5B, mitochondrial [Tilletia horrida]|uniref:Cytochrome c oxidase subunit 5B, mitochondrial n=1 Tax=Tilletia horrida TaxID=155126 RepID=A0AAN6GL55_9BASI|nr:Cytochrome c oxidase subunit 5B, mitochondrial [Tilletia horrida]KAK0546870.1 Cytochrome c oxidase subunit 5B, mitochondrial [Tilletia horrida]KAK0569983.1 Cytochrome c oxidase subunit 5B, mitochondrial [Tilletia horrida]